MLLLTADNFDSETYGASCPVIVMFYADWCSKCAMMKPVFDSLEKKNFHRINFLKVDIEQSRSLAEKYETDIVPTFIFFKNGQIEAYFSGVISEDLFDARIKKIFRNC